MTAGVRLTEDLRVALKARDTRRVSVLRLLLTQVRNEEFARSGSPLSDEDVLAVVRREAKKRKEAAEAFQRGNRLESAVAEDAERAILESYLPVQLLDADLEQVVHVVAERLDVKRGDAAGTLIGAVMGEVRGKADGARVRAAVERYCTAALPRRVV